MKIINFKELLALPDNIPFMCINRDIGDPKIEGKIFIKVPYDRDKYKDSDIMLVVLSFIPEPDHHDKMKYWEDAEESRCGGTDYEPRDWDTIADVEYDRDCAVFTSADKSFFEGLSFIVYDEDMIIMDIESYIGAVDNVLGGEE